MNKLPETQKAHGHGAMSEEQAFLLGLFLMLFAVSVYVGVGLLR